MTAATPSFDRELDDLRRTFDRTFGAGGRIHVVRSPGRVNLIGEHTDYNDGFVLPMAIEPHVLIACRARDDGRIRLASTAFSGRVVEFSTLEPIARGEPSWANYPKGVAAELIEAGIPIVGMDALYANTLPPGSGLSSSAAMEVGTARALLKLAGHELDDTRVALLCQKAEHEYARVPCGIMDQTIVAAGRADHAMLLDCRDNAKRFVKLDGEHVRVVIVNSMVKHELSGSEYGDRRRQCEEGVAFFQKARPAVRALRDVSEAEAKSAEGKLPDVVFRRVRHVVGEIARTVAAADLLEQEKFAEVGQLMLQSHASLRDDYEVSTPELDYLVEQSMTVPGVYGARMTGGGFGGCIVALARPDAVDALTSHLNDVYPKRFNVKPGVFVTTATDGAKVIE